MNARIPGLLLACAAAMTGCARPAGDRSAAAATPAAQDSMTTITGRIAVTGSEPATQVTIAPEGGSEGGAERPITGPLRAELARLAGAVVAVQGRADSARARGFLVSGYEVVSVDGRTPRVGVLAARDGGLWLEGRDTLRLEGAPALAGQAGAKLWVLGQLSGGRLAVDSYGVIREAGKR